MSNPLPFKKNFLFATPLAKLHLWP